MISRRYCRIVLRCLSVFLVWASTGRVLAQANNQVSDDPLIQILVRKGVLDDHDSSALTSLGSDAKRSALLQLLREKGVISSTDYKELDRLGGLTLRRFPVTHSRRSQQQSRRAIRPER